MLRWAKCSLTASTYTWYFSQLPISFYAQIYLILDRRYQVNTASIFVWDSVHLSYYKVWFWLYAPIDQGAYLSHLIITEFCHSPEFANHSCKLQVIGKTSEQEGLRKGRPWSDPTQTWSFRAMKASAQRGVGPLSTRKSLNLNSPEIATIGHSKNIFHLLAKKLVQKD